MGALRLVTLNTWKCDGDYPRRLDEMARSLAALAPDLVALQEVFAAPELGLDTASALGEALGMAATILPLRRKPRPVAGRMADSTSGLALLSRRPVSSSRAVMLPDDPRDGERAALAAELDWGGRRLGVAVLHLTHLDGASTLRQRQWQAVAGALSGVETALAAGDFNAPVEEFALGSSLFRDCRTACGQPPRATLAGGGACIDHVLWKECGLLRPVAWTVAEAGSDHLAVIADFAWVGPVDD